MRPAFQRDHIVQPHQPGLRHAIGHCGLAAIQPAARCRQHHPAISGRDHVRHRRLGEVEPAFEMHIGNSGEILDGKLRDQAVAHVPGIVDQDIDPAPLVDGGLHDGRCAFRRGDGMRAGHRLPACRDDLGHHLIGRIGDDLVSARGAAIVVDHHFCPARCQQQRIGPTKATPGPGDHRHAAIESEFAHAVVLFKPAARSVARAFPASSGSPARPHR